MPNAQQISGTTIFSGAEAQKGLALNKMSLVSTTRRTGPSSCATRTFFRLPSSIPRCSEVCRR